MIALLSGVITHNEANGVVLDVHGVGYRIFTPRSTFEAGEKATFFISEVIRDDRHDLYGFRERDEQRIFEELTNVQGVGPKLGLKIMGAASLDRIAGSVEAGDVGFFTSISGVGRKTAQKLILELKGILVVDASRRREASTGESDVKEALESLGYGRGDIEAVLPHVVGNTPEARLKSALKMMGKR